MKILLSFSKACHSTMHLPTKLLATFLESKADDGVKIVYKSDDI